ncbi:DNA cytosine methyltransferase [Nitratireductor sp. XY-223]|uniref:DNA cytosine methyltransferase n=1 Tax=Nitratireductor sp. XY-223 TaxID=2561926 RepID=UPI0010A9B51C|nr:DNA cytosine methyltransferase [Nitratireductor sp. XY-223]
MAKGGEFTAIDLFCGAGGLSEGFRQSGFHILAGNDFDEWAGATFAKTHSEAKFLGGPIQDITTGALLKAAGLKKGQLDCLIGGPPCQAFSVYNHQRGMHDDRSQLFKEYLRMVEELEPNWVVMENVTGITSAGQGAAVKAILSGLEKLGYTVDKQILRAEEYGVPQERRRIVFIGNKLGKPILFPEATHGEGLTPFTTIFDAIGDLPELENGEDNGGTGYLTAPETDYQKLLRGNSAEVLNHSAPRLAPINMERMKHIPQGGSWRDIPFELLPDGMKRARRCDHTKRYGRMSWSGLSCTILTKCDLHWGAYLHPEQDRSITVREAARIQSFPDWFCFEGPRTEQYVQVGNAVPPLLGRKIGEAVLRADAIDVRDNSQNDLALAS